MAEYTEQEIRELREKGWRCDNSVPRETCPRCQLKSPTRLLSMLDVLLAEIDQLKQGIEELNADLESTGKHCDQYHVSGDGQ